MNTSTVTPKSNRAVSLVTSVTAFLRYNAFHVFAGKFLYFLLLAIALFLTVVIIHAFSEEVPPNAEAIYYFLLVPGVLLMFYPSCYAIQSDADTRMLETLFGIPDYRYKVWLARNFTQYVVIGALLLILALFCRVAIADFSIWSMVLHLLFPIVFLSSLAFMLATLTRSGNGTASIMVIIILVFWIATEPLEGSRWDLFHNPFTNVDQFETFLWAETTMYNRIYLLVGSILSTMFGLLRLQKREKFA